MKLSCPHLLRLTDDGPILLGSRCRSCGEPFFPFASGCTLCGGVDLETIELGDRGILWTWTIQDTDSGTEIMHMAENGFCGHGEQDRLLRDGSTEIGGRLPLNTDGGCLANGEPIGASGLRQVHEICVQLRGLGGARQVPGKPKLGYAHVYGAPGVSGVTILQV